MYPRYQDHRTKIILYNDINVAALEQVTHVTAQCPGRFLGIIGQNPSAPKSIQLHLKLRNITPLATKVHMILQSFVTLTWMCDATELV